MKTLSEYLETLKQMDVQDEDKNHPVDMTNASEADIIKYFRFLGDTHHKSGLSNIDQFYGGITSIDDIKANLSRHHIDCYLGCVRVKSYEIATKKEGLLCSELNVYIGKKGEQSAGNGGNDDSNVVYLADRTQKDFVEY